MKLDGSQWISPQEALAIVAAGCPEAETEAAAKELIEIKLTEGTLLARPTSTYYFRSCHAAKGHLGGTHELSFQLEKPAMVIPAAFWLEALREGVFRKFDYALGEFVFDGRRPNLSEMYYGKACDVLFHRNGLLPINISRHDVQAKGDSIKSKRGRLPEYDWLGAMAHIAALAHTDNALYPQTGEPSASSIARVMEAWFHSTAGKSPADSELRKRAALVMTEINALKINCAGK